MEITRLRLDDRGDFDRWQAYVHARPDSHCTDLGEWRRLYRELYGIEDRTFVGLDRGRVVGALSLYHIRSPFTGRMLVTCPFFGYGGFYWESEAARNALMERAEATARELRVDYIEIRSREPLPPPYRANTDFAEFNLELEATSERNWTGRLAPNARQNVRKARSHDLDFRVSTDHRACYEMLRRTLRAHGTPFHDERFFRLLERHLAERVSYSEVRHGSRLVAGGVVIRYGNTIITPYIGSLEHSRSLRANYLQYWGLIEHGLEHGVRRFELGRSPRGTTHARFKKKWGAEELPVFYNYLVIDPRRGYRTVSRPSALQRLATRVWRRLPLALTTALGPRLYRYIP